MLSSLLVRTDRCRGSSRIANFSDGDYISVGSSLGNQRMSCAGCWRSALEFVREQVRR